MKCALLFWIHAVDLLMLNRKLRGSRPDNGEPLTLESLLAALDRLTHKAGPRMG